jgi:hypothetical protein
MKSSSKPDSGNEPSPAENAMRKLSTKDTDTKTTDEDAPTGPKDPVLTPDNKLGSPNPSVKGTKAGKETKR